MQKRYRIRWMILGIMIFALVHMFAHRHFKLNSVVPDGRHGGKVDIVTTRNSSSQSSDILNNRHNEKFSLELKGQQSKLITVVPDNLLREKVDIVTKSNFSSQSSDISNNRHTGTLSFQLNSQQSTLNIIVPDHLHGGKVDIVPTSNSSSQSSDISSNRHNGTLGFELKRQQSSHNTVVPPLRLGGKEDIVTASNSSAQSSNISNIRNNGKLKRQQSNLNTVVSDFLPEGKIDIVTTSNSLAQSSHITNIRHNGTLSLRLIGRLGNQMFQYASILGLADMLNFTHIVLEGGQDLQSSFQLSDNRVKFTRISTEGRIIGENVRCAFDKRLTKFNNTEDVHVIGYLLSWTYFHNIEKHIRKEFAFSLGISSEAKRIKLDIAKQLNATGLNRTYVGVHIRRGDFLEKSKIEFGHFAVTKGYINRAIQLCIEMFGNETIFIFGSDGIDWVKDNFKNNSANRKMAFLECHLAAVDMAVLSSCDHTIVSTGSFGWWAAWLAGGTTIISKHQAVNGSQLDKQFVLSEYFLPNWKILD